MKQIIKAFSIILICCVALTLLGCNNDDTPSLINTTVPIETTPTPNVTTPADTTPSPEDSTTPTETSPTVTTAEQTTPADTTPPEFDGWSDFH